MSIRDELKFIADNEPNLTEKQKQIGGQIMKEIKNRLQFCRAWASITSHWPGRQAPCQAARASASA